VKSICYVVLPDNFSFNDAAVNDFVLNQIRKYFSELEIEPYKKYFSKEETLDIAYRHGFSKLADFEEHLKTNDNNDGIENGLYYWITTYNTQGHWDYFRLDGVQKAYKLENELPYSVVTPDGVWHSEQDYGYKPILDYETGEVNKDNNGPENQWKSYLDNFFSQYRESNLAIIYVHS
jgi:hypothetical protein